MDILRLRDKILLGEVLTGEEVEIIFIKEPFLIVDEEVIDEGRWSVTLQKIFKIEGRFFSLWYNKGKTELQTDEYYAHKAVEVIPVEVRETVWQTKGE